MPARSASAASRAPRPLRARRRRAAPSRAACARRRSPRAAPLAAGRRRSPDRSQLHSRAPGTVTRMNLRRLGRTGLEVSEVGYGAWGIGQSMWIGADDAESLRALERAIDLGLNFIDTALAYGDGHSEQLVGKVVRGRSETVHVATKIPPQNMRWPASGDDASATCSPASTSAAAPSRACATSGWSGSTCSSSTSGTTTGSIRATGWRRSRRSSRRARSATSACRSTTTRRTRRWRSCAPATSTPCR